MTKHTSMSDGIYDEVTAGSEFTSCGLGNVVIKGECGKGAKVFHLKSNLTFLGNIEDDVVIVHSSMSSLIIRGNVGNNVFINSTGMGDIEIYGTCGKNLKISNTGSARITFHGAIDDGATIHHEGINFLHINHNLGRNAIITHMSLGEIVINGHCAQGSNINSSGQGALIFNGSIDESVNIVRTGIGSLIMNVNKINGIIDVDSMDVTQLPITTPKSSVNMSGSESRDTLITPVIPKTTSEKSLPKRDIISSSPSTSIPTQRSATSTTYRRTGLKGSIKAGKCTITAGDGLPIDDRLRKLFGQSSTSTIIDALGPRSTQVAAELITDQAPLPSAQLFQPKSPDSVDFSDSTSEYELDFC